MMDFISFVFFVLFNASIVYIFYICIRNKKKHAKDFQRKQFGASYSYSEYIGKIGESAVSSVLEGYCRRSKARFFDNITLPFDDGTTQIDHILLSHKGILVIETKNWSGMIYGKVDDKNWTQVFSSSKNIYQNPIRQNYKHWLAVCSLLSFLPQEYIQEVVVFTGRAVFKTGIPDGVLFIDELEEFLDYIDFGNLSDYDIRICTSKIESNRLEDSEQTDLQHKEYLDSIYGNTPIYMNKEYVRRKRNYQGRK